MIHMRIVKALLREKYEIKKEGKADFSSDFTLTEANIHYTCLKVIYMYGDQSNVLSHKLN